MTKDRLLSYVLYCLWFLFIGVLSAQSMAKSPLIDPHAVITAVDCDFMRANGVIAANNPIACERLRTVSFKYLGYDKQEHLGQFVVIDVIAPHVANLMSDLFHAKFPISKASLIRNYSGNDRASMADNNSSAFNGRAIKGSTRWSMHAYGAAIDINPLENPFIEISEDGNAIISPASAARYSVNRSTNRPNKRDRRGLVEPVVDIFAHHGFVIWGGDWDHPIDYQHFQFGPRSYISKISKLDYESGLKLIAENIDLYRQCRLSLKNDGLGARKMCVEKTVAQLQSL